MAPSYTGPGLLALPVELRLKVYSFILTSTNERWNTFETYDGSHGYYISHSVPPTHRYKYRANFFLLFVCRQIRDDVLPLLLGYPHAFDCLQDLCEWVERAPPDLLPLVKQVHVRVASRSLRWMATSQRKALLPMASATPTDDVEEWIRRHGELLEDEYNLPPDLRFGNRRRPTTTAQIMDPLIGPLFDLVKGPLFGIPSSTVETSGKSVIELLWRTFERLSQVKSVRIVMGGSHPKAAMTCMADQQLLVLMIAAAMPDLQHLSIVSAPLPWPYFAHFQSLQHVELSGFGPGTPADAAAALAALPRLTGLTLRWSRASYDLSQRPYTPHNRFLFRGDALAALPPLARFALVCDDRELSPTYFDASIFEALSRAHKASLREFRIDSRPAPESFGGVMVSPNSFDAILALIRGSQIRQLTLQLELMEGWVKKHGSYLDGVLPASVRKTSIFVKVPPDDREGRHELLHIR